MRTSLVLVALACAGGSALAADSQRVLTITGVSQPKAAGPIYLKVLDTDADGDTIPDAERVLRIVCAGNDSPAGRRPVGQPMAAGLGTHLKVPFIKEWSPPTPELLAMQVGYRTGNDIREMTDGWERVSLTNAGGLCDPSQTGIATKSRSNIQNN